MSIYLPSSYPMPSIDVLERECQKLRVTYRQHLAAIEAEFSEEKKQAYLANLTTPWFGDGDKERDECLTDEWNRNKADCQASSARKLTRLSDAQVKCDVEIAFQAQHCYVHANTREGWLFGYYKVTRYPTYYSFVLKRRSERDPLWTEKIGNETKLPISLDMSAVEWTDVTPQKIHSP